METKTNLKAPLDSEGFVVSFEVNEEENIRNFWKEYGFVVIKNCIPEENVENTIDEIWRVHLEKRWKN